MQQINCPILVTTRPWYQDAPGEGIPAFAPPYVYVNGNLGTSAVLRFPANPLYGSAGVLITDCELTSLVEFMRGLQFGVLEASVSIIEEKSGLLVRSPLLLLQALLALLSLGDSL